jgi:hypothetical protein
VLQIDKAFTLRTSALLNYPATVLRDQLRVNDDGSLGVGLGSCFVNKIQCSASLCHGWLTTSLSSATTTRKKVSRRPNGSAAGRFSAKHELGLL